MSDERKQIGKWTSLVAREKVFQTADGIEIDSNEHYEVARKRVFFDDVMLITYHREKGVAYLIAVGILAFVFCGMGLMALSFNVAFWPMALVLLVIGFPAFVSFMLRLALGVDVITVHGRRSKAAIRFRYKKRRARELYGQLCATVRNTQRKREMQYAAEEAANAPPAIPAEEMPPLPPAE